MRIDKITYQQTFPTGQFQNQKLGVEIVFERAEDVDANKAFELAKKIVNDAFQKLNVQEPFFEEGKEYPISPSPLPEKKTDPKEQRIKALIDTINMCSTVKNLKMFEGQVAMADNREVQQAFFNKLQSLQNQ